MRSETDPAQRQQSAELGVHSLDHFALSVPDLSAAHDFYSAFGLDVRAHGNDLVIHTFAQTQRWGLLTQGRDKRLRHLSFGVFDEDFARFKLHIEKQGIRLLDAPRGVESDGVWINDPDGILIEVKVAPKSSPFEKGAAEFTSSPSGTAGAPKRSQAGVVRPSRLSHCLTFTRDVSASIAFYQQVLGLRLSDRSGDDIAFMHGIHGSDHHLVAFARSGAPGLHHCCWNVRSLNEIGLGATQMAEKGYVAGWGLGRHVLGSNYFHYVRDPWNSHCEYSCDMDYIAAGEPWQAGDHDAQDAFYVWGPRPPEDWTHNHEAEQR
jgi:catechol 2,3-dioxygenase-like lactoylglutathione lyase family enzyme